MNVKRTNKIKIPKYTTLTLDEILRLIICVAFDIAEYAAPFFLIPVIGDILDIAGIGLGVVLFGWLGLISILELLPLFDYFPFFILTWFIWYYLKREKEKERVKKLKEKWK